MKKITSILLIAITFITISLFAQDKFGHIHSENLMIMPETADADKAIQEYSQMLETQLQAMYGEYQTKAGEFQTNEGLMTDIVKEAKIKEIQDLEYVFSNFNKRVKKAFNKKEMKCFRHFLKKHKMLLMKSQKNKIPLTFRH